MLIKCVRTLKFGYSLFTKIRFYFLKVELSDSCKSFQEFILIIVLQYITGDENFVNILMYNFSVLDRS